MPESNTPVLSRRGRRIEEALLEVDGVAGVRVWELPDRVEIGVRVAPSDAHMHVLKRVSDALDALREPDETWELGLITEG